MKAYITIKEVGNEHPLHTTYIGEDITEEKMIEWFGLNEDDVEDYSIRIEE